VHDSNMAKELTNKVRVAWYLLVFTFCASFVEFSLFFTNFNELIINLIIKKLGYYGSQWCFSIFCSCNSNVIIIDVILLLELIIYNVRYSLELMRFFLNNWQI
jgi:hypothetical protein